MSHFHKLIASERNRWSNWVFQSWNTSRETSRKQDLRHRLLSQLKYVYELRKAGGYSLEPLEQQAAEIAAEVEKMGGWQPETIYEHEHRLGGLIAGQKSPELLFIGHSHIDINWQWGWDETVTIVLETMRTVIRLMERYPDLVFSQSQALVYDIIERYDTGLLESVMKAVSDGRWEPLVSCWVESDKNIPSTESLHRQLEYGKLKMSELFSLSSEELQIAFEPDTFGHSLMLPEILSSHGIRYYYFCRGMEDDVLFHWQAPSGRSVLAYRDPKMYTMGVSGDFAHLVPAFSKKLSISSIPALYGVSNHGGGITIRDVEMILEMQTWPAFPKISFSRMDTFFKRIEEERGIIKKLEKEINPVFTACYTSGSRIKKGNFSAERQLFYAEAAASLSACSAGEKSVPLECTPAGCPDRFRSSWEKVLTGQFHDIITGVGVDQTFQYVMSSYQEVAAVSNTAVGKVLRRIADDILVDLPSQDKVENYHDTATGAGAAYGSSHGIFTMSSSASGCRRIFHIWNFSPWKRRTKAEVTLWNYEADVETICCSLPSGEPVPFQKTDAPVEIFKGLFNHPQAAYYWGHWYVPFLVDVELPAFGYSTVIFDQAPETLRLNNSLIDGDDITRSYHTKKTVLENRLCSVLFDPSSFSIVSLFDKESGSELLGAHKYSGLYIFYDDNSGGMDSWEYGREAGSAMLKGEISSVEIVSGALYRQLSYTLKIDSSEFRIRYRLMEDSCDIECDIRLVWREYGIPGRRTPTLIFLLYLSSFSREFLCDIPGGTISRKASGHAVSGTSYIRSTCTSRGKEIILIGKGIHGFFGRGAEIGLALLRSSTDPNPLSETGTHHLEFMLSLVGEARSPGELARISRNYRYPAVAVTGSINARGGRPSAFSYFEIDNPSVELTSIRETGEGTGLLLRLIELDGKECETRVTIHEGCVRRVRIADSYPNCEDSECIISTDLHSFICRIPSYGHIKVLVETEREEE